MVNKSYKFINYLLSSVLSTTVNGSLSSSRSHQNSVALTTVNDSAGVREHSLDLIAVDTLNVVIVTLRRRHKALHLMFAKLALGVWIRQIVNHCVAFL